MSGTRWGRGDGEEAFALEKLPPGPHRLPRELVRENQRRRILLAALDVFSERGFASATVRDLIRAAHVSRATFYEIFADKEACMAALHEDVVTWLWQQAATAVGEAGSWSERVRAAVAEAVRLLAEDPRLATVCAFEAPASAPRVRERHDRMVEDLGALLRAGRSESPYGNDLPEILEPALVCGAIYLVGRSIVHEQGPGPKALSAELSELILVPYRP